MRLISATLYSFLFVCTGFTMAADLSPTRIRVVVPLDSTASFDQTLTELVRQFNSNQNNYRVELLRRGTPFQNLRSIIASHYANDLPDLALIHEADVGTLVNLNLVQSLPDKWLSGKKFLPEFSNKLIYSIPFQRHVAAWFFNREFLFKLNQKTERIPTQWVGLADLSLKLSRPGEHWGLAVAVTGDAAISHWTAMGYSATLSPIDASVDFVQRQWNTKANFLPSRPSFDEATRRFLEQKAVVLLGSIAQTNYLATKANFKIGSALPEGDLTWSGTDFVLLAKTPSLAAGAREFLDFLYRPDQTIALFKAAACLPVTRSQATDANLKREIEQNPLVKSVLSRKVKHSSLDKIPPQIRDEWALTVWKTIETDVSPTERTRKSAELRASLQKLLSTNPR